MAEPMPQRVTAQSFYDHNKCPHRVFLNVHGDPTEKLPLADFLNLLFERALLHEEDVVRGLEYVMPEGKTLEERFESTTKLMAAGVERIYQGVLLQTDDSGIPDLLEKVTGKSAFGNFFYKPVDVKIGSGYQDEAKGKLREDYGLQLYHYGKLLEAVQNAFPPAGEILNKRGDRVPYMLVDFQQLYQRIYPEIRDLVRGTLSDEPVLSGDCRFCQWWGHCEPILEKTRDISLLPGIGRSLRSNLKIAGITTIPDIENFDFAAVKVSGVGPKRSQSLVQLARVARTGTIEVLARPALPDPALKIFFDFEDDPTQDLIFLCGIATEPDVDGKAYHGRLCLDEGEEAQMWQHFQAFCVLVENQQYKVFHYSPYENTKIVQLERKYGVSEKSAVDIFRNNMIDLLPVVRDSIVPPTRSYGIKDIAPLAGHKYSVNDPGGAQAIVSFQEYQRDHSKTDKKDWLLSYNREDCVALKRVYEWLKVL